MKRVLVSSAALALAVIAVGITVLAQTSPGPAHLSQAGARARFIHASPDAEALDVVLDGREVFTATAFGQISAYADATTGTYTVTLRLSGDSTSLVTETVVVTETDYTLAAAGTLATGGKDFEVLRLVDDNSPPDPNMVRARFVHLVPDAPAVDIAIEGELLFEEVSYGDATEYAAVPPGTHTLEIQTVLGNVPVAVTVGPNNVYSFFALGRVFPTPDLDVLQVLDESYNHPVWLPLVTTDS